jgi:hypothetical protein
MAAKTGTWLIAMGAFIAFIGLCFLPAAFGANSDRTMLDSGSVILSTGMLLIAGGLYVKASALGTVAAPATTLASGKRTRKSICDRCAQDEPVIQCRVHQLHLCANCLSNHYDFRSCAYVPSTRRGAPAKSTTGSLSQTASR